MNSDKVIAYLKDPDDYHHSNTRASFIFNLCHSKWDFLPWSTRPVFAKALIEQSSYGLHELARLNQFLDTQSSVLMLGPQRFYG